MKTLVTSFKQIEEIFKNKNEENSLFEELNKFYTPYKSTWNKLYLNCFNDFMNSDEKSFDGYSFYNWLKINF